MVVDADRRFHLAETLPSCPETGLAPQFTQTETSTSADIRASVVQQISIQKTAGSAGFPLQAEYGAQQRARAVLQSAAGAERTRPYGYGGGQHVMCAGKHRQYLLKRIILHRFVLHPSGNCQNHAVQNLINMFVVIHGVDHFEDHLVYGVPSLAFDIFDDALSFFVKTVSTSSQLQLLFRVLRVCQQRQIAGRGTQKLERSTI